MARHYYLTRSGALRRKDNTLFFEPSAEKQKSEQEILTEIIAPNGTEEQISQPEAQMHSIGMDVETMGDLSFEPGILSPEDNLLEAELLLGEEDSRPPVKVADRRTIPVEDVEAIWAFGELSLNSRVLVFLSQKKIPIHFFNYYGFYAGSFYPRDYLQAGFLIVKQVRHYTNKRLRLKIAREFISAALDNILRNLSYYGNRGLDLQFETEGVKKEISHLAEVKNIQELMACEGRARAAYYQAFSKILRDRVEFTKRVRRPPDNPVNALISFTNGLVYAATLSQIYRTQLDPTISFLHEPGVRRFSLALDLAEIFKPMLADRLIFKLINNRQLQERDFAQDLNCCYLKESGRKTILKEWDNRLEKTIQHRDLHRKVSYERLIRLECYKLVKHLTNVEPYKGFRAWW